MAAEFVTIATYDTPPPAHLALGMLRDAGIDAMLRNEGIVAGAWDLGQASHGVEVRVLRADAPRAQKMVEEAKFHPGASAARSETGFADADEDVDLRTPEERVEAEMSRRALNAAAFGIVFPPLQLYSLWLLLRLKARLAGRPTPQPIRKQMIDALMMDMVVIIIACLVISSWL